MLVDVFSEKCRDLLELLALDISFRFEQAQSRTYNGRGTECRRCKMLLQPLC